MKTFPKPADVKWDLEGFATHKKGKTNYLLVRAINGTMEAHQLRIDKKILQTLSTAQLIKIARLAGEEFERRMA